MLKLQSLGTTKGSREEKLRELCSQSFSMVSLSLSSSSYDRPFLAPSPFFPIISRSRDMVPGFPLITALAMPSILTQGERYPTCLKAPRRPLHCCQRRALCLDGEKLGVRLAGANRLTLAISRGLGGLRDRQAAAV